ncbi:hypothetical protein FSP39_007300 [Pinctada imbricata]|uniref:Arrestin C-terminal-like domain-containing protein n=1 Tax=Pinctada imbricata TaxID=66713 RepID=A0AA88Y5I0_PINIB|nr:hypothetical protein FSP39_007300 [Pinctada imbricata]
MDIPYSSSPQGKKYFTIIGPHIDCMDERFLSPTRATDKRYSCCFCCTKGPVTLEAVLERSAYCCGENIRLRSQVQNGSDQQVWITCKLVQNVEFFINKGVLGLCKEVCHRVWEYQGDNVPAHHTEKIDNLQQYLQVPVMPPTLSTDVCSVIQIYYTLKVCLSMEKSGDALELQFPLTIATTPFRIPNAPYPILQYDAAVCYVEGGMYVSSEFQLGQVYMGDEEDTDDIILYRPVYVCVPHERLQVTNVAKKASRSDGQMRYTSHEANEVIEEADEETEEVSVEVISVQKEDSIEVKEISSSPRGSPCAEKDDKI